MEREYAVFSPPVIYKRKINVSINILLAGQITIIIIQIKSDIGRYLRSCKL